MASGETAWFGWPKDDLHEKLRDGWARAATLEERREIARRMQDNAWNFVPMALLGQWTPPVAYRANITGVLKVPTVVLFWNVEKA
jgi:peptide/nickel transport system substrate-binding protein